MSYTLSDFRTGFPEFAQTTDANVTAAITRAGSYVSETVFGTFFNEAMGLKTAQMLTASPTGIRARAGGASESKYDRQWRDLIRQMPRATLTAYGT